MLLRLLSSLALASAVRPLRLEGLMAAVFTPFDGEGEINLAAIPQQWQYLQSTGIQWVFVCGTTGESLSLTVEEREALTEAWAKTEANVVVHVGAEALKDAQRLAAHAAKHGAKAIGAMPPTFLRPANAKAAAAFLVSTCKAAPFIPCYYYHIPSMTNVYINLIDLVFEIDSIGQGFDANGSFAGIKDTGLEASPGFVDALEVMRYKEGKYEVLGGREELMLPALAVGIKGFVGSQFNYAGDLFNMIREAFAKEDHTSQDLQKLQMRAIDLISAWRAPAGVDGNKRFAQLAGLPVGDARPPALPVADAAVALSRNFSKWCLQNADLDLVACKQKAPCPAPGPN
ncbi:hypothetical protein M885DRAFT_560119 [Pelagophyceae sp. CCMP2097]|nr:hypothetical protein M885DRAFT_560119 [Pelagophyceae sp. CCMP2097]